ncbi:MAG: hypothetical protein ACOH2Q_23470 [Rhodococcus sp. (in: high G+C Gram-positive bacteria)]
MWRFAFRPIWVDEIVRYLRTIIKGMERIMATQAEFDAKVEELDTTLDVVAAGVSAYAANTAAQDQVIADLKAQIAAGLPVDLTKLEKVNAEAKAIAETFAKVVDPEVPTPPAEEFPAPEPESTTNVV